MWGTSVSAPARAEARAPDELFFQIFVWLALAGYAGLFAYSVFTTQIRAPFSDMLVYIANYLDFRENGDVWKYLWSPHTQHRLIWTRAITWLDIEAFGGSAYPFTLLAVGCLALTTFLLTSEIRRASFSGETKLVVGVFAAMLCLTAANAVDCSVPIESIYPHTLVFAVLAIVLFTGTDHTHPDGWRHEEWRRGGALLAAMGAGFGSAVGLAVWPILAWLAWKERRAPWLMITLICGGAFVGFYIHDMPLPASAEEAVGGNGVFYAPEHLLKILHYGLAYLGLPWTRLAALAPLGEIIGAMLLLISLWFLLRGVFLNELRTRLEKLGVALILFSLATAALAAVGRVDMMDHVEVPVRYSIYLVPLHVGLLYLLGPWIDAQWRQSRRQFPLRTTAGVMFTVLLTQQAVAGMQARGITDTITSTIDRFTAGDRDSYMNRVILDDLDNAARVFKMMDRYKLYQIGARARARRKV